MMLRARSLVLGSVACLFFAVACSSGDDDSGGDDGGDGATTDAIGPEGGTVAIAGAELVIPAGALDEEVDITIEESADEVPAGFLGASPVYRFEPDGLVFAAPVTARIDFEGAGADLDLIWSTAAADGYQAMGAAIEGQSVVGAISHFSRGFAGQIDGGGEDCGGACAVGEVCVAGQCVSPGGDADGDGIDNVEDNCPAVGNPAQGDHDMDGTGDDCDPAACSDGGDNDDDTYADEADSGCFAPFDNTELVDCNDGIDNDGDGLIDAALYTVAPASADPGCYNPADGSEWPGCSDGIDNDEDGAIDMEDSTCLNPSQHFEAPAG